MKYVLSVVAFLFVFQSQAEPLTIVGLIPGAYFKSEKVTKTKPYELVAIKMDKRIILEINKISKREANKLGGQPAALVLKNGKTFDVIYPGLINLHNHTKQNNLSVWGLAKGQFQNRFEWRDWGSYTFSVSSNMNPWVDYGKAMECAAFRWSEVQALVLGTTYLQGPSSCVNNFGIHRVEDKTAFISQKDGVQAPTDLVLPNEMTYVWNTLRPIMESKKITYEEALKDNIYSLCEKMKSEDILKNGVNSKEALAVLSDQAKLKDYCGITDENEKTKFPPKFVRYVYWVHKTIAGKKAYLAQPNRSAIVVHLAEGRRSDDAYNKIEFQLLKLLGIDQANVNMVHAVGSSTEDFKHMAQKGMGIVWSPFSNLLLYGETLDVKDALAQGVNVALGSDWTPTGSRSVLEELKIAREYVQKNALGITDEQLFDMVTKTPAKMINHYVEEGATSNGKERSVGTIRVGAMASLIAISLRDVNPYTNIVTADEKNLNLVIVDGKPIYGNEDYIKNLGISSYEDLANHPVGVNELQKSLSDFAVLNTPEPDVALGKKIPAQLATQNLCQFSIRKVLVSQTSNDPAIIAYKEKTGLDLDTFQDIQRLLGVAVMTQPRNLVEPKHSNSKPDFATKYFASLYSCNDPVYQERFSQFIRAEIDANTASRVQNRKDGKLEKGPKKLAADYQLTE